MGRCHHVRSCVQNRSREMRFHIVPPCEHSRVDLKSQINKAQLQLHHSRDPSLHGKALWAGTVEFFTESIMGVLQGK